jgi:hypothetical protein
MIHKKINKEKYLLGKKAWCLIKINLHAQLNILEFNILPGNQDNSIRKSRNQSAQIQYCNFTNWQIIIIIYQERIQR